MDAIALLRLQFQMFHRYLESTMADVTPEQARWSPPGRVVPLGAQYAHVLTTEDEAIHHLLEGTQPLSTTTWAGRTGLSEPQPEGRGWGEWARRLRVDLPALRQYAEAVYAATDRILESLSGEDLDRPLDLTASGRGQQTVASLLGILLSSAALHCGEISCLKGLQGAKGYPS